MPLWNLDACRRVLVLTAHRRFWQRGRLDDGVDSGDRRTECAGIAELNEAGAVFVAGLYPGYLHGDEAGPLLCCRDRGST